ncbi:protein ALP1-like [Phalaenopsis equestris]|uniref:protein ALP1-like n=1 Tax=Phalaenopsis equestris TaxID=78828 RepID=UPI0009E62492|nr:protein ALP1-like [Phalaenopsis equestris]XP_020582618.1 protein ALP1-like [Phalaenopsis equestris]
METRPLAALVSSLVSQALLLLLLIFQSNPNLILPSPISQTLTTMLHLLSSTHLTATTSHLPLNRKRRREMDESEIEDEVNEEEKEEEEEEEEEGDDNNHRHIEETTPCSALVPHPNPDHFKIHFGMRSATFEWLASLLDPLIDSRDPSGSPFRLPTTTRLALALARLATGADYADLASRYSVSESAARFCTGHLCRVLCTNFRFWLAFPSSPELLTPVSDGFASLAGLPGCCGAMASARFRLHRGPATAFLVADVSSRILSFAAVFHGERSGFEVLKQSSLYKDAMEGRLLGPEQYLVGDESQQLYPWLMVPFAKPVPGSCEEDFNLALRVMCWPARRAIYSLHNWRVLSRLEEESTKVSAAFIGTCSILHNILLMKDDDSALADVGEEYLLSSEEYRNEEKHSSDKKAILIRSTLAVKARECGTL